MEILGDKVGVVVEAEVEVRRLCPGDFLLVGRLHQQAFPHLLWTSLTPELVAKYFAWQTVQAHDWIALGAWVENKLVGYCVGARSHVPLDKFYIHHLYEIARGLSFHSARLLLAYFFKRAGKFAAKLFRGTAKSTSVRIGEYCGPSSNPFYIVFVGVDSEQCGLGIGKHLVRRMEKEACVRGFAVGQLDVEAKNTSAVRVYESLGWRIVLKTANRLRMEKMLAQAAGGDTPSRLEWPNLTTKILGSDQELSGIGAEWEQCRQKSMRTCLDQHLKALMSRGGSLNRSIVRTACLLNRGRLIGATPCLVSASWQFGWRIPQFGFSRKLARFDMRLAEFRGPDFMGDLDETAARTLYNAMLKSCDDCDVIRFRQLRTDSILSRLVSERASSRNRRWVWQLRIGATRWLVRISGTSEDYLKKHSGNTRKCIRRDVRKLEQHFAGCLRLSKITEGTQVDDYVRAAHQVAEESWQRGSFNAARSARLRYFAEQGWLRGYLLTGNGQPLAYVLGRQADGCFYADDSAFDLRLENLSPGKVLWLKVIEDLHAQGDVKWLDFGSGDIGYKQFWAHESYPESSVLLIKPSVRNALAFWPMMAIQWPVTAGRRLAGTWGKSALYDRSLHRVSKMFRRKR